MNRTREKDMVYVCILIKIDMKVCGKMGKKRDMGSSM